jgi:hypothetical protein
VSRAAGTLLQVVAVMGGVLVVWYLSLIGLAHWCEWAYPWTDRPACYASLHIVDERLDPGSVQWRPKPGVQWIPVMEMRSAAERAQPSDRNRLSGSGWLSVGPLIDHRGNRMESAFITVRVGDQLRNGSQEYDLQVQPRTHMRLRLVAPDRVFVGPEHALR